MKKYASILDYSYPGLDPSVWDQSMNLYAYQKDFILRLINTMYTTYNLKQSETWVEDVVILGSLTTSKWLLTSDVDVHIRVNLDAFIVTNMPGSTKEEAFAKLDETRKEFDRAKILAPMTQHPCEFYFESLELHPSNIELVGVYSLLQNKWLKAPVLFEADLDLEESKRQVVEQAEALAEELDSSFGKMKRDIQRVNELETVIKAWDKEKQQLFYTKVEKKLNDIEEEIKKDLKIKQDLVDARHEKQNATSEIEIKFKWLARFGFFSILSNLKELLEQTGGQITTQELPLIEKIISEGSIEVEARYAYWIDPSGNVYPVDTTHAEWIGAHDDHWFKMNDLDYTQYLDPLEELADQDWSIIEANLQEDMISRGWARVGDISGGKGHGIQVADLHSIPKGVFNFLDNTPSGKKVVVFEDLSNKWIEVPISELINGQKAINKALSHKRLQTASIKEASNLNYAYWVDPVGKIYTVRPSEFNQFNLFTHSDWVVANQELLKEQYGLSLDVNCFKIIEEMYAAGWARIGDSGKSDMGYGITVGSLSHIPEGVNIALAQFYKGEELIVEGHFEHETVFIDDPFPSLQKAVNKALSRKRLQTSSIKQATRLDYQSWLVDPSGKVYKAGLNHAYWIWGHKELLENEYGIQGNFPKTFSGDVAPQFHEIIKDMQTKGWTFIGLFEDGIGCNVNNIKSVPEGVFAFLQTLPLTTEEVMFEDLTGNSAMLSFDEVPFGQKVINEVLQQQRMGSIKEAFLKEAFGKEMDIQIAIDFDGTIAVDKPFPDVGEPMPGVKEALSKFKELGYTILVYTCRSKDQEGLELVREYLDKYQIPYDSIFEGEKPFAKFYIDDRAIHFDNWKSILNKVEKSEKKASICITANLNQKYWIDPSGKEYVTSGMGHNEWAARNVLKMTEEEMRNNPNSETLAFEKANDMLANGWTRITTESDYDFAIEVGDINNLPPYLDNFVASHYTGGGIEIDDLEGNYQDLEDPFPSLKKQINKARQLRLQPVAKAFSKKELSKQAGNTLDIEGVRVYKNPTYNQVKKLWSNSSELELRFLIDPLTSDLYVWDAYLMEHYKVWQYLGIPSNADVQFGHMGTPEAIDLAFTKFIKKQAQTKKVKQGDYSCLMALVPHDLAQEIVEFGVRTVPDDKLYLDDNGKLGRELESHITIKYGLLTNDAKHVRRSFNDAKPFHAKLGKVKHFQPPELPFDVLTVEVISEDLEKANKKICDSFDCAKDLVANDYKPHITIAYLKRDTAKEYIGSDIFEGKELELDTVIFSPYKGNRTYFSISQDKESQFILESINKFAVLNDNYWIAPDGKEFSTNGQVHAQWISDNLNILAKYGFNMIPLQEAFESDASGEAEYEESVLWNSMLAQGWTRISLDEEYEGIGIQVNDIKRIPSYLDDFLISKNEIGPLVIEDGNNSVRINKALPNLQKAVNKALQYKRLQPAASLNKKASMQGMWVDPNGQVYYLEGLTHGEWVAENLDLLNKNYNIPITKQMIQQSQKYFTAVNGGEENIDAPDTGPVWNQMFKTGWVRIGDAVASSEDMIELQNLSNMPPFLDDIVAQNFFEGNIIWVEDANKRAVKLEYNPSDTLQQAVNKALSSQTKTAEFLPSLFQAPDNKWQFEHGGDDKEIALNPDPVSDETTWYAPCTEGKPRSKDVWRQFISIFDHPISKKDVEKESVYNPELEEAEKKSLGEDETLLEYSKGFYDPKKHDFPHNTTWLNTTYQDQEPSKPLPVTYSPQTNEDNLDQNSPGGYPRRFMGKPKGEWFSNEGEVNELLINMLKNKEAAIDSLTIDITAEYNHAYWIDPNGKIYTVRKASGNESRPKDTHGNWIKENQEMLKNEYGLVPRKTQWGDELWSEDLSNQGWIRIGDGFDSDWGITVKDLNNIPSSVDNLLSQFAHAGAIITIEDSNYKHYSSFEWPVKSVQQAVQQGLRKQLVHANKKQAAISHQWWIDPSGKEYPVSMGHARWIWDNQLFLSHDYGFKVEAKSWGQEEQDKILKYVTNLIELGWTRALWSDHVGGELSLQISNIKKLPDHVKHFIEDHPAKEVVLDDTHGNFIIKQAGSQSASVPDYLMDEWKTEQINDDTDEAPYANRDQRNYPYGLQDSPQDTTDFNWPKDNQPYVVRLDVLYPGPDRPFPAGTPDYEVTIFPFTYPQSDGIEATNPSN